jgi:glyoxylase-like metal-dependent hydrolase (beta-lactamase superfamily II)
MSDEEGDRPKLICLGEGFYVRQGIDNIAWMDLGENLLVIDALEQPELEGEIFAAIESTCPGKPVGYVLNTHTHYDHVALNAAFARRKAQIINQELTPLPEEGRRFGESLRTVHMRPMPGCHTAEDCVVFVEPEKVLFVGDIFGWGCLPLVVNLRADTLGLLERTYAELIASGAKVVVPGHGPLCTTAELGRWIDYLHDLIQQVKSLRGRSRSDAAIQSAVAPPTDMTSWWRFLKWKHADCVARVIKVVRNDWL